MASAIKSTALSNSALRPHRLHWVALILLAISVCINYADRGNLGVAARSIETDLHFNPEYLGILLGGFFWTYSLFQILAGKLIDRWNVHWVYAVGFLVWSGATAVTGLANTFLTIFVLRLFLGFGESVAYPAYSKIIATSFPEQLRGTANAMIDSASKMGPALGVLIGVKMIQWYSWRTMFVAIGGVSLLWLVPWCFVVPRLPAGAVKEASGWAPTYRELISKRALWGTVLGLFGGNYTWYLFLTWLPYYFESERHYTKDRLAWFGSLPFWVVAAASMLFGLVADALIRRGWNPGRVRQTFVSVGLAGCFVFLLPAVLVKSEPVSNICFMLACISLAGFSSNHWAFTQMLAGPSASGTWTGFENCLGNFSGVIAPYVSGWTLLATHSFMPAFVIAGAVSLAGALGFSVIVGKPQEVAWHGSETTLEL